MRLQNFIISNHHGVALRVSFSSATLDDAVTCTVKLETHVSSFFRARCKMTKQSAAPHDSRVCDDVAGFVTDVYKVN